MFFDSLSKFYIYIFCSSLVSYYWFVFQLYNFFIDKQHLRFFLYHYIFKPLGKLFSNNFIIYYLVSILVVFLVSLFLIGFCYIGLIVLIELLKFFVYSVNFNSFLIQIFLILIKFLWIGGFVLLVFNLYDKIPSYEEFLNYHLFIQDSSLLVNNRLNEEVFSDLVVKELTKEEIKQVQDLCDFSAVLFFGLILMSIGVILINNGF